MPRLSHHRTLGRSRRRAWVVERFQQAGLAYRRAVHRPPGATEDKPLTKSDAYLATWPAFTEGRMHLLDHPQLLQEWKGLERRERPGGRVAIDHRPGMHDDLANATAIAVAMLTLRPVSAGVLVPVRHAAATGPAMVRLDRLRREVRGTRTWLNG